MERWGWLRGLHPNVSWLTVFKRYYVASGPPIFSMEVVFGCDNPQCAMYQCEDACALCNVALPSWKYGMPMQMDQQRYLVSVTGQATTRAIAIAVWLYKKGYRGFEWKSKEEYDESGEEGVCELKRFSHFP